MPRSNGDSPAGRKFPEKPAAYFDIRTKAIVVRSLIISSPDVLTQARLHVGGPSDASRKAAKALDEADLTEFVQEVISTGARTMAIVKRDHEADHYVREIRSVTEDYLRRLDHSLNELNQAAESAGEKLGKASAAALRSLNSSRKAIYADFQNLLGGENPDVLTVLEPVINRHLDRAERRLIKLVTDFENLVWAILEDISDPDNPKSSTAQLMAKFSQLTTEFGQIRKLLTKVLSEFKSAQAAEDATEATTNRSTLKGTKYEDQLGRLLTEIASGLGCEYLVTRNKKGTLNSTKGDGVLLLEGGDSRVVIEMMNSDQKKRDWNEYLDEAERNRRGTVSVGLVRTRAQNANEIFRTVGGSRARRFVVAFDPMHDDPTLLRTIVLLACWAALAVGERPGPTSAFKAQESIAAAISDLQLLNKCVADSREIQTTARRLEERAAEILTSVGGRLKGALASLKLDATREIQE